jgi:hypothetical protein
LNEYLGSDDVPRVASLLHLSFPGFQCDRRNTSDFVQLRSWSTWRSFWSRISKIAWNEHSISDEAQSSYSMRWDDMIVRGPSTLLRDICSLVNKQSDLPKRRLFGDFSTVCIKIVAPSWRGSNRRPGGNLRGTVGNPFERFMLAI